MRESRHHDRGLISFLKDRDGEVRLHGINQPHLDMKAVEIPPGGNIGIFCGSIRNRNYTGGIRPGTIHRIGHKFSCFGITIAQ